MGSDNEWRPGWVPRVAYCDDPRKDGCHLYAVLAFG